MLTVPVLTYFSTVALDGNGFVASFGAGALAHGLADDRPDQPDTRDRPPTGTATARPVLDQPDD